MEAKNFAEGVLIGAIAGAISGILLAPKSGEETRGDLMHNFDEIKGKVTKKVQEAGDFSKDIYDRAVSEVVSGYKEAQKITPDEAQKIVKIFEKSFEDVEKIINKDVKKIKESANK